MGLFFDMVQFKTAMIMFEMRKDELMGIFRYCWMTERRVTI